MSRREDPVAPGRGRGLDEIDLNQEEEDFEIVGFRPPLAHTWIMHQDTTPTLAISTSGLLRSRNM